MSSSASPVGSRKATSATRMADRPLAERPRERCLQAGAHALSLRECLALLFASGPRGIGCLGLAEQVMAIGGEAAEPEAAASNLFRLFDQQPDWASFAVAGLGPANLARLTAVVEICHRYASYRLANSTTSSAAPRSLKALTARALRRVSQQRRSQPTEWLGFIPLYEGRRTGHLVLVGTGRWNSVTVDTSELFSRILALRAGGFWLCHNHPSGALHPSADDLELTMRVRHAAQALGLTFLGHWLVTAGGIRRIDS